MDDLCTDKTGTLTQDRIILKRHLDIRGQDCERVLEYAYLNSHYQSGLKNLLDVAVLQHVELGKNLTCSTNTRTSTKFLSTSCAGVSPSFCRVLICKGAVEEVFAVCKHYELEDERGTLDATHLAAAQAETAELNEDGFRVVAIAYRKFPISRKLIPSKTKAT